MTFLVVGFKTEQTASNWEIQRTVIVAIKYLGLALTTITQNKNSL